MANHVCTCGYCGNATPGVFTKIGGSEAALMARITQLESDSATTKEDAALVADENKRLRRIAEAAVRYLTHQDYDGLLNALRAEGYLSE